MGFVRVDLYYNFVNIPTPSACSCSTYDISHRQRIHRTMKAPGHIVSFIVHLVSKGRIVGKIVKARGHHYCSYMELLRQRLMI